VRRPRKRGLTLLLAAACFAAAGEAQEARTLELPDGERVSYTLRVHPADAHLLDAAATLPPASPLQAAKLLNRHLLAGNIEEAALLSNAPRRRFEVFREYRDAVGEDEFKRVFGRYFYPENRLLAEIAIGRHRLLIWELKDAGAGAPHVAGQYFVEVEGRYFMDDVPSATRSQLRQVLEAWRSGAARP